MEFVFFFIFLSFLILVFGMEMLICSFLIFFFKFKSDVRLIIMLFFKGVLRRGFFI